MRNLTPLAPVIALALSGTAASAAYLGDALFPQDMNDKARAEIVYENLQRGLDIDSGVSLASDEIEADLYMVRIRTDLGPSGYLDFDLGGFDPSGGDVAFYGGVGLRYLAYDAPVWRLSTVAQIHYAPNVSAGDEEHDFLDGDLALLLAGKMTIDKQLTIMPYVGPVVSIVRLDGDAETEGDTEDFDAEEDSLVGVAVGIALELPGQHGLRVEGQFFDEASISAAASFAF
jgi:hypothetical protein